MVRKIGYLYKYEKRDICDQTCKLQEANKSGNTNNGNKAEAVYDKKENSGYCKLDEKTKGAYITIALKETSAYSFLPGDWEIYAINDVEQYRLCMGQKLGSEEIQDGKACIKINFNATDDIEGIMISNVYSNCVYIGLWDRCLPSVCIENRKKDQHKQENGETKENKGGYGKADSKNLFSEKEEDLTSQISAVYNRFCKKKAVIDNKQGEVVMLKPQDFVMFPRKMWRLSNNYFVMRSYYNHRIILLFKTGSSYKIGVVKEKEVFGNNNYGFTSVHHIRIIGSIEKNIIRESSPEKNLVILAMDIP